MISGKHLLACAALLAWPLLCTAATAEYPLRPVRLIVPFAPGGGADIVARFVGQRLTEVWGQQVVIDNRGGASAMIGTATIAPKVTPTSACCMCRTRAAGRRSRRWSAGRSM